jgi:hypothetical protein
VVRSAPSAGHPADGSTADTQTDDHDSSGSGRHPSERITPTASGGSAEAVRAAAIDALGRDAMRVSPTAAAQGPAAHSPTGPDLDRLIAQVVDHARTTIGTGGANLATEFEDPTLGSLRLTVMQDPRGLIRAVLTASDPISAELLQQAADRHRAAGELASIDLHIRSATDAGRQRDPVERATTGSAPESGAARDGRRHGRESSDGPSRMDHPTQRPARATRRADAVISNSRSSRLGRTIDRIA